jgi:hypothetical protein
MRYRRLPDFRGEIFGEARQMKGSQIVLRRLVLHKLGDNGRCKALIHDLTEVSATI